MRARPLAFAATLALLAPALLGPAQSSAQSTDSKIPSIELSGELNPAQADWIGHGLNAAADDGAQFAIIRLDSPGGLDTSAEEIVDHIRSAPLPVVVYVSPGGAQAAAEAGSIVDAADVAAMAPGTTLEALANDEGENTALKQGRIDLIASDQDVLLQKLDGFQVEGPKSETLSTSDVEVDDQEMTLPFQLLDVLVNPNVAFLLLLIGLLGLALEAFAPGTLIPGAIGAVALVLGLIGAVQLPIAAIGVLLLVAGIGLIIAEAHLPTGGFLGVLGVAALIGGGHLIFNTDSDQIAVSPAFVIAAGAVLGLATVLVGDRVLGPRRRPGIESEPEGAA
jgi:membrane-bound serine protease (ClpP class)